ncbi:MAG: bifunctional hydroxymethylpyrimidine kinase/phosphomethylpyrimidine kinase [Pseudomonadota bacterium]
MHRTPRILTIAGSDSSAGAGIQADLKTAAMVGVYCSTAITAVTVQNSLGVHNIMLVPENIIKQQITYILDDIGADIIKIGMLGDYKTIRLIAEILHRKKYKNIKIVLDPVMVAKGGKKLLFDEAIQALCQDMLPLTYLITPNIPEAEILANHQIVTQDDVIIAAQKIKQLWAKNVLVKGGHFHDKQKSSNSENEIIDVFVSENDEIYKFSNKKINSKNSHGTGCTLATAIASKLAYNESLYDAINFANKFVNLSIANAYEDIGSGHGPVKQCLYNENAAK